MSGYKIDTLPISEEKEEEAQVETIFRVCDFFAGLAVGFVIGLLIIGILLRR